MMVALRSQENKLKNYTRIFITTSININTIHKTNSKYSNKSINISVRQLFKMRKDSFLYANQGIRKALTGRKTI